MRQFGPARRWICFPSSLARKWWMPLSALALSPSFSVTGVRGASSHGDCRRTQKPTRRGRLAAHQPSRHNERRHYHSDRRSARSRCRPRSTSRRAAGWICRRRTGLAINARLHAPRAKDPRQTALRPTPMIQPLRSSPTCNVMCEASFQADLGDNQAVPPKEAAFITFLRGRPTDAAGDARIPALTTVSPRPESLAQRTNGRGVRGSPRHDRIRLKSTSPWKLYGSGKRQQCGVLRLRCRQRA
jgi:hypothetical protein